jgi:glycerol kinase
MRRYAAGLATGFWNDLGELRSNWRRLLDTQHGRRRTPPNPPLWKKTSKTFDWTDDDVK